MTDADLQTKRLIAAGIDIGVLIALVIVTVIAHFVMAFVVRAVGIGGMLHLVALNLVGLVAQLIFLGYMLGRDVIGGGASIGKKSQGIRAVTASGQPVTFMDSAKRNAIFAIGSAIGVVGAAIQVIPVVGCFVGCLILPLLFGGMLLSLVAAIVEVVKIFQDPDGIRFGDQFAGTRVVR